MKKLDQPTARPGVRYTGRQTFDVQQPADPEAHLTAEQKTWPLADWGTSPSPSEGTGTLVEPTPPPATS